MQWLRALQKYHLAIRYISGEHNSVADALSRRQDLMPSNEEPKPEVLLPVENFVELDTIAVDNEITAYLDVIATDNEIMERIQKMTQDKSEMKDLQYKNR